MTTTNLIFKETELRNQLASFPCWKIVAFAACCAERLMPAYARYSEKAELDIESSKLYVNALELIWGQLSGLEGTRQDFEGMEQRCLKEIPSEDNSWEYGELYATDAGAAVTFAIRTWLSCDPQEAVYAAQRVYDAVDNAVNSESFSYLEEEQILCHPLIQRELSRQKYDLEQLETSVAQQTVINELRFKAQEDALTVFQV